MQNGHVPEGEIRRQPDGSLILGVPAAIAAAQAKPPGQLKVPQPVAQVIINIPVGKLPAFYKLVEEWMTDEAWTKREGD